MWGRKRGGKSGQTRWLSSSLGQHWELEAWQQEVLLPSRAEWLLGEAQPCLGDYSPGLCVVTGQPGSKAWILHKPWQYISKQKLVLHHYVLVLWVDLFVLYIAYMCIWLAFILLWIQPTTD